ncbi:serine hydrolase domain-containing protein [Myceligenerans indicum]|uniref:Serine hydrolase n=1 Tax=Myceligenerans indicum TaxID=2593663 RepID=A0ABS1LMS9_9MICO|nr:serine hydrolase domain-containing protein [Myceligenerans indicum]MBL0887561.1 serine hydrolase [Myceligenerans indicum]
MTTTARPAGTGAGGGPTPSTRAVAAEAVGLVARRAAALDIALHTVEVSVRGELVAHAACAPRGPHVPQRMYSVSKTVTGLAVGLLEAEGALSADDPITAHFPEMSPVHPWLEATTIRHLLTMRGPHRSTTYRLTEGDWLASYFRVPPTHPPGTLFTYDTSAAYTLAALVERLSGASLADYLRPRLSDPLGVGPDLRFLTGPDGISHGGSGLICTPRDLLRLAHLLLADGVHDGVRLIPAGHLRDTFRPQADTTQLTWGGTLRGGYGYQTWLPARGGWLMFGLGGQIVYGDPARGLAVVVTADAQACTGGDQRLLDDVMDRLVDPLTAAIDGGAIDGGAIDGGVSGGGASAGGVSGLRLEWPAPGRVRAEADTSGGTGAPPPARAGAPASVVAGTYRNVMDGPGPAELALVLGDGGHGGGVGRLSATSGHREPDWSVELRLDGPVSTRIGGDPAVVTAGCPDPSTLDVRCAVHGEDLATWRFRLAWAPDGSLAVRAQAFCESADPAWTFEATYVRV